MPKHYIAQPYIAPQHQATLALNKLTTFNALWDISVDWFEEPNQRRGGWSGVGKLQLKNLAGESQVFYLKKQQNHGRRTWLHPIKGEPTFRREFANLQFLFANQFAAPTVVFYAEASENSQQRAVLVTAELTGFKDMAELMQTWYPTASQTQKMTLIKKVANEIRRFHGFGLVHRALYPKHIFVKNTDTNPGLANLEVAVIDCEKMRNNTNLHNCTVFDLSTLNRHSHGWRNTQKLAFFKHYLQVGKLDLTTKKLARQIIKRAERT